MSQSSPQKKFTKKFTPLDYQQAARLADEVSQEMLSRLQWVTLQPQRIVDVGCGTGSATKLLRERYGQAEIFAVDVAYPMLQYVRKQEISSQLIQADAHQLPFKNSSVDLLIANFLLPWCEDPLQIFREWRRVLRPDGLIMFSCLGPDSMREWQALIANFMLPNLTDMHDIGDALLKEKFVDPVMDVDYFTLKFPSAINMLQELQASEMLINSELPEHHQQNVEVRFEIIYGHAFAPHARAMNVADENGVIKIPLSQLTNKG